jgi:molybdate transport system substrate-binding protein
MIKPNLKTVLFTFMLMNSSFMNAEEYKFYSAAGIKLPIIELSEKFKATNPQLTIKNDFDTAGAAEKKFLLDVESSCLITTQLRIDKALKDGALKGDAALPLVDTLAGIAYSGKQKPTINSTEDLRKILLQVNSLAFSDPAKGATVGLHFVSVLKTLGIEKEVMQKATMADDGVQTMKLVTSNQVELGITQVSEIVQADAKTLIGPFPKEFELSSRYALWCKNPKSENMIKWKQLLKSKEGEQTFTKHGLRVVQD